MEREPQRQSERETGWQKDRKRDTVGERERKIEREAGVGERRPQRKTGVGDGEK